MKIELKIVLFFVGVLLVVSVPSALAHTDVTAEQARELIDSTDDLIVVDVREPFEYDGDGGHIPGALNYPWFSEVLQTQYKELPMDDPVLVVCGSGRRSHQAAEFLDSMDFSIVYDMLGGMKVWTWETEISDADSEYGGTGEPNDPYLIYTAGQLNAVGAEPNDWDKHFKLMADIDLSEYSYDAAVIAPDTNDVSDGFQGTPFTGVFDGNDHTISNLTIEGASYLGLFGQLGNEGEISNLGLEAVDVNGTGEGIGGLVGSNEGWITTSHSSGTVTGDGIVGGLVGINFGTVTASSSTVAVVGIQTVGGMLGVNFANPYGGRITTSCSAGTVDGERNIGGLVGANQGQMWNCFSTAAVSGTYSVGGIVGLNAGQVVPDSPSPVGSIYHCYATGPVIGNGFVGGLVGEQGQEASVELSVWDVETSGLDVSAGGTGLITAEMQTANTFLDAGWDFVDETDNGTEDLWSICEGTNYPRFVWQIPVGDFLCPDGITMDDFLFFLEHWLDDNCDSSNDYCEGTDLDQSGTVDENDLEIFLESWSAEQ